MTPSRCFLASTKWYTDSGIWMRSDWQIWKSTPATLNRHLCPPSLFLPLISHLTLFTSFPSSFLAHYTSIIMKSHSLLSIFVFGISCSALGNMKRQSNPTDLLGDGSNDDPNPIVPRAPGNEPRVAPNYLTSTGAGVVPPPVTMGYAYGEYGAPVSSVDMPNSPTYAKSSMSIYTVGASSCQASTPIYTAPGYGTTSTSAVCVCDQMSLAPASISIYTPITMAIPTSYTTVSYSSTTTMSTVVYPSTSKVLSVQSASSASFGIRFSFRNCLFSTMIGAIGIIVGFHRLQF